jgi:hypothetical protein
VTGDVSASGRDSAPDLDGCEKNHCHGRRRDGSGKVCHRPAGWGTDHAGTGRCKLHGGSTVSHRRAAQVEEARAAVVTYGLPREVDPGQALLEEVHRTAGHVAWLASVVADLEREEVVWGVVEETDKPVTESGGGTETKRKAVPHAYITLYQSERQHLARVSKAAIDAGVSERVVAVYEQIAGSYVTVLERVLDALELSPVQRAQAAEVAQRELRALAGGAA